MRRIKSWMDLPFAVSITECAEIFRVGTENVLADIRSGRLKAVVIGNTTRILTESLRRPEKTAADPESEIMTDPYCGGWTMDTISPTEPFTFLWPTRRGRATRNTEEYPEAYSTRVRFADGRVLELKIGITERECAGKVDRKRVLVIVNDRPMVEFVGDDDFGSNGLVAAVIKPDGRHHLRYGEPIPDGYGSFDIRPYNQIVRGPKASGGLAIVCSINDHKTMVDHGILRWQVKEEA